MKLLEKEFLLLGKPNISEEEIKAVTQVLKSGWIGTGKVASQFEKEFQTYIGRECVAVSSATMGLILSLKALGLGPGSRIVTTPLTFCATVNAILSIGAEPIFVDVNEEGLMDVSRICEIPRIDAVIPVHYTGASVDMDMLMEEAKLRHFKVIEDAAHSFGGYYGLRKQGSFGDISVFSFYATKNITSGEGGMVCVKDPTIAQKVRILSKQGQSDGAWERYTNAENRPYSVVYVGDKGNMPDVLAAIGLAQFRRSKELLDKRSKVWRIYEEAFGQKDQGHSQHLYTLLVNNRDHFRAELHDEGIGSGVHYDALHLEPAYRFLGYKKGDFPKAEKIGSQTVSLPLSNSMSQSDAYRVVDAIENLRGTYATDC